MSTLSDGDGPSKEEPTGKRRNNARRRNKRGNNFHGKALKSSTADAPNQPTRSASGGKGVVKDGSGNKSGKASDVSHRSNASGVSSHADARGQSDNRTHKNRHRKKNKQPPEQDLKMRHMRAPLQRQADVTFKDTGGSKKHPAANFPRGVSNRTNKKWNRPKHNDVPLYAALDLGTNNCRLLIAMPQEPGRFRVIDGFSRIVRLGEGMDQTGVLSEKAMNRAVEALKVCAVKLKNRRVRRQKLIATEACRQAANGEAFLKRVRDETGIELEIVNRETEARLAAEGCGALIDRKADAAVLFDIGGGSSELILVGGNTFNKKRIADRIKAWTSLPLGVVTLAERFGGEDVTPDRFEEMIGHVMTHIDAFEDKNALEKTWKNGRVHLLGTSGTVTTLAGIHLNLERYDRRQVDGIWLQAGDIDTVIARLLDMGYDERAANPCVGAERADLVLAGCAILEAIRRTWPAPKLRVADRGLREGLLTEMMSRDGSWIKRKKKRWNNRRSDNSRRTETQKRDN